MNVSEGYVSCLCLQPALQKPNRYQIIEGCFCQILNDSRAAEWPFYKSGTYLGEVTRQLLETLATFKIHVGGEGKKPQHNSADFFLAKQRIQASYMGSDKILKSMLRVKAKPRLNCFAFNFLRA